MLLIEAPADRVPELTSLIEDRLSDFGADARSTAERLAEFHRVENTYLSTFQTLGGAEMRTGWAMGQIISTERATALPPPRQSVASPVAL
jgi:hypothetical protein